MTDRKHEIREQIAALQAELTELERYRYQTIVDSKGHKIELRDDSYRIYFRIPEAGPDFAANVDPNEWYLWAEYKHCDLPGPAREIADALMQERTHNPSDHIIKGPGRRAAGE